MKPVRLRAAGDVQPGDTIRFGRGQRYTVDEVNFTGCGGVVHHYNDYTAFNQFNPGESVFVEVRGGEGMNKLTKEMVEKGILNVLFNAKRGLYIKRRRGICYELRGILLDPGYDAYHFVKRAAQGWPEHSGRHDYPCGWDSPFWQGEGFRKRIALINYILDDMDAAWDRYCNGDMEVRHDN